MTKKIVIIEADHVFVSQLKGVIKNIGASREFEVLSPSFSKKALNNDEEIIESYFNSSVQLIEKNIENIAGVFCDIRIVESNSKDTLGVDIAIKIKQKYPLVPIINITNHYQGEDIHLFGEITLEEIDGVLPKSYFTAQSFTKQKLSKIFEAAEKKIQGKAILLSNKIDNETLKADIAIITALHNPEFAALLDIFKFKPYDKNKLPYADTSDYFLVNYEKNGVAAKLVAATDDQMGMPATTSLATRLIQQFQPKFIIILGICAGVPETNIGDILIAEYCYDYGSGKNHVKNIKGVGKKEIFTPYYKPYGIDESIRKSVMKMANNKQLFMDIKSQSKGFTNNDKELKCHIGPFVSGAAVIASNKKASELKLREGKLIGFDMEAYGVFYAANNCNADIKALSIKSVSDFGDEKKKTPLKAEHQLYASYTSVLFFKKVLENVLLNYFKGNITI